MARKEKIDNGVMKRFARERTGRRVDTKDRRAYFLIVCEGEKTEPNYFEGLKNDLPPQSVHIEIDGQGRNTLDLVKFAIERRQRLGRKLDRTWVVFDKDDFSADSFNSAISLANQEGINTAWSNQAFELWYVLHFHYLDAAIDRDQYNKIVENIVREKGIKGYSYSKGDKGLYKIMKELGDESKAINYAETLCKKYTDQRYADHCPCTRVHLLVKELRNPESVINDN
ncbi:MAG TPA: RloB family protein [Cyclobacteriaceae bacterium]|nr:RloB family protein [Cyclobacteriaceae bacterium]